MHPLSSSLARATWALALAWAMPACGKAAVPAAALDTQTAADASGSIEAGVASSADGAPQLETQVDGPADAAPAMEAGALACTTNADCPASPSPCAELRCDVVSHACLLVQRASGQPCDDGDPCTLGDSCAGGACTSGPKVCGCAADAACAPFDDGDLCNGVWFCDKSGPQAHCAVKPAVVCPPSTNVCATMACAPSSGLCGEVPLATGAPCDDGLPCTVGDHCAGGSCVAKPANCACQSNSDCPDDADLCNGKPYCDKSGEVWQCALNPGTVVNCGPAGQGPCVANLCQPKTGTCEPKPANSGAACQDGEACTAGDVCVSGQCKGKYVCGCQADSDCLSLEDGNACNGTLYCNSQVLPHVCAVSPATVVVCNTASDTSCSKTQCSPKTGTCAKVAQGPAVDCDDGNPCTVGDQCAAGVCGSGANTCACQSDADCAAKDDDNLCNGVLYCDKGAAPFVCKVNVASLVVCSTAADTACKAAVCQPKTGMCAMANAATGTACDADGSPCTAGDACDSGACKAGVNTCMCQKDADCAVFDDGNPCNGSQTCNAATNTCVAKPGSVVVCPSGNDTPCLANTCQPATATCAMQPRNEGKPCDADGTPCTVADSCTGGVCAKGPNLCGCLTDLDCAPQEDGNLCNGSLYCDKTAFPYACKVNPASVVVCKTASALACHQTACVPQSGLCQALPLPEGTSCTDGVPCTMGDTCLQGSCVAGPNLCNCTADADCAKLDDGNPCNGKLACDLASFPHVCKTKPQTVVVCPNGGGATCVQQVCNTASGACVTSTVADSVPCDDGNSCTLGDVCSGGQCAGAANPCSDANACTKDSCSAPGGCANTWAGGCADGNPCTADGCDKLKGCQNTLIDGAACNDGKACSVQDVCQGGVCVGQVSGCDDGNACTADTCATQGGCAHLAVLGPCDDKDPCSVGDGCGGGSCQGVPKNCDDGKPCTLGACGSGGSCAQLPDNATACSDNNTCTLDDYCANGSCTSMGKPDCDDNNGCTLDTCSPATGCVHANLGSSCSDGNQCTINDVCVAGACLGQPMGPCGTTAVCYASAGCEPLKGCVQLPSDAATCTDNLKCTDDSCKAGKCVGAPTIKCDDGDPCTGDTCDTSTGTCSHSAGSNVPCNDGKFCTDDVCQAGVCTGVAKVCSANAVCDEGAKACKCAPFYAGDGVTCAPVIVDECANGSAKCAVGAMCQDLEAGFACHCPANATVVNGICTADFLLDKMPVAADTRALVVDGTTVWLGGAFKFVGPRTGGLVATDPTTGAPTQGMPEFSGTVAAVISDGAGGWFVGGSMTHVAGYARSGLVHLKADGTLDAPWLADVQGVTALALSGTTLYLGGTFLTVGGKSRVRLAAVEAATGKLLSWNADVQGSVAALAVAAGRLWVGGSFSSVHGKARANLAALGLSDGLVLDDDLKVNGGVATLASDGQTVFVLGSFSSALGQPRSNLARFDAQMALMPLAFAAQVNSSKGLALSGSTLFVYGYGKLCAVDVASGQIKSSFVCYVDKIQVLATSADTLWIGGTFTVAQGAARQHAAAVDITTGKLQAWDPRPGGAVAALAVSSKAMLVGGSFAAMPAVPRLGVAAVDAASAQVLPATLDLTGGLATAAALLKLGDSLWLGGWFSTVGGQARQNLAEYKLGTASLSAQAPNPSASVSALVGWQGRVVAIGAFSKFAGITANGVAVFDPAGGPTVGLQSTLTAGSGGAATLLSAAVVGNTLYVGGEFAKVGGQDRMGFAAFALPDLALSSVAPAVKDSGGGYSGKVYAILPDAGNLWLAGEFRFVNGHESYCLARIDAASGAVDKVVATSAVNGRITALAGGGDAVLAAGILTLPPPLLFPGLSTFAAPTKAFGAPKAELTGPPAGGLSVTSLQQNGKHLYITGNFIAVGGAAQAGWARVSWP